MRSEVLIVQADETSLDDWERLRFLLWPQTSFSGHRAELNQFLSSPEKQAAFIVYSEVGGAIGFAEVCLRYDYVNGCNTSPVAFLEGIFVDEAHRRMGIARALFERVVAWSQSKGVEELASDAGVENRNSHIMHEALGFEETERVVYFRRKLTKSPSSSQGLS
ncbi:aminoglycoside 6'-N-acetyltransferase [Agrobacterium sp. BA1120]|uniref:aminoglycoside 6'-N-acetyltransferase n=1 Tax=Agrobacterium sp. BA1120 TaxID=3228927 RepID=UPI003369D39B